MSVVSLASKRIRSFACCVKQPKGDCQELTSGGDPQQHYKLKKITSCHLHGTSRDTALPALVA